MPNPTCCPTKAGYILPIRKSGIRFMAVELLVAVLLRTCDLMREQVRGVYGIFTGVARSEFKD